MYLKNNWIPVYETRDFRRIFQLNVTKLNVCCCIFVDLSKAFDTVVYDILLQKLDRYFGIRGLPLKLIRSYLTNRYQYTKIIDSKSSKLNITCGAPQGSTMGPLLFLMYINNLPWATNFATTLFADDAYLMLCKSLSTLESNVNRELYRLDIWLRQNKLSLNISNNSQRMADSKFAISINSTELARTRAVKYMGIFF